MMDRDHCKELSGELDRRNFMRFALLGSAAILVPADLLEALESRHSAAAAPPSFAAFHPLAPGAVRAEGWLGGWLEKQVVGLGSQLTQTSWPFTAPYWQGEEGDEKTDAWWPWEQKAYWIDGATRLALVTGNDSLLHAVRQPIDFTLAHASTEGYLGPNLFKNPIGDFHRWPQAVFIRSLSAASDAASNDAIVAAVQKHYLADSAGYGVPIRNITNLESILWCYEHTGDPRLLTMAETAWADYASLNGAADGADLQAERVFADTPIDAHGVSYSEISKQPAILYVYTGKPEYLRFALAAQKRIFDHHMLIDGIPSTEEHYGTTTSLESHETCDISDHTWSWGYMLMATGDGVWADRIERACFNAGFGAVKKDWKGIQYFSCPNQFIATQTSDHNAMNPGRQMMSYQPNPGHATACCGGDVHRLFPNYVIRMWMHDPVRGIAATFYGPSRVKTTVGPENHPIEISEVTDYPFDEQIHFTIHTSKAVEFPFSLRIPAWCDSPSLLLNGKPQAIPAAHNGFATISRKFQSGDTLTLALPMRTLVSSWPQNAIGLEHGPLVYALPIKENWTQIVEQKWSTTDFPSWDAQPSSPWNYGLNVDPAKLADQVRFERKPMTPDPWVDPPVTLTVPAQTIPSWILVSPLEKPDEKRTPPLPIPEARQTPGPVEQITLVPYGSTHLRLTIFPDLTGGRSN